MRPVFLVALFILSASAAFRLARRPEPAAAPRHSFDFNHRIHLENDVECADCHAGTETGTGAGIPDMAVCMGCHDPPQGNSEAEGRLHAMAAKGEPLTFHPATELATAGVLFSHARHVKAAKLACETCHGDMKTRTRPPEVSTVPISMDSCLACHAGQNAEQDCLACHR